MEAVLLTIDEVAELEGLKNKSVLRKIHRNNLNAIKVPVPRAHGFEYRISINELTEKAQARYLKRQGITVQKTKQTPAEKYEGKTLEDLTKKQREQVAFWLKTIEEWQQYTGGKHGKKTEKTSEFVEQFNQKNPRRQITERTLYDKRKIYREYGEVALADGRIDRSDKGSSTIPEEAWLTFQKWWLDEAQPPTATVYKMVEAWAEMDMPQLLPLPSLDSFYRRLKTIPESVVECFRYGTKALDDKVLAYVPRDYYMDSNDVWCADYHTLDFFVRCYWTGRVYRAHMIVWLDIRSRKILSAHICETANSDGVFIAFRKAVERFGFPRAIYIDNGREFLVHDFAGRGKRKTDENADYGLPLMQRLGVDVITAKVKNARAKIVERFFKTFTENFSKFVKTYCGGRPEQKPERLEKTLKNKENIPYDIDAAKEIETYIEGCYNNETSRAKGVDGMTHNQCYAHNLFTKRTATEDQLNLMLVRSTRSQKVKRNGVVLKFNNIELWYYHHDLINVYFGKQVYLRYNPENLSTVRVYDEEERYITVAELLDNGGYGGEKDKEIIKKINRLVKEQKDFIKGYMDKLDDQIAPEAKEILLRKAQQNIEQDTITYEPKVLQPTSFDTRPVLEKVVGEDEILSRMVATVTSLESKRTKGE